MTAPAPRVLETDHARPSGFVSARLRHRRGSNPRDDEVEALNRAVVSRRYFLLTRTGDIPAHAVDGGIAELLIVGVAELVIGQSSSADCLVDMMMMSCRMLRRSSDLDRRRRHQCRKQKRNKGLAHLSLSMILPIPPIVTIKYEVNCRNREFPENRSQLPKS
jgi:hypothetical protein